jgi:hypothetical protein
LTYQYFSNLDLSIFFEPTSGQNFDPQVFSHLPQVKIPKDPKELSFWVATNLPLDDGYRLKILEINCAIQRLRFELSLIEKVILKLISLAGFERTTLKLQSLQAEAIPLYIPHLQGQLRRVGECEIVYRTNVFVNNGLTKSRGDNASIFLLSYLTF